MFDVSIRKKKDFSEIYHQQGTSLKDSNKNNDINFGENNNY